MTHACCPGSYDPMTSGHLDVIKRVARQFSQVTVLATHSPDKQGMFGVEERMGPIRQYTQRLDNVRVDSQPGLLVDYTSMQGVIYLAKGLCSVVDYKYKAPMTQMNRRVTGTKILFVEADPKYGYVSPALMKEVIRYGGSVGGLIPEPVLHAL